MTTVTISLPESLREFIEVQVRTKGYGNVSEYFRGLLREAQERESDRKLEALLLESLHDRISARFAAIRQVGYLVDSSRPNGLWFSAPAADFNIRWKRPTRRRQALCAALEVKVRPSRPKSHWICWRASCAARRPCSRHCQSAPGAVRPQDLGATGVN